MCIRLLIPLCLAAVPVFAQTPMSADQFEAYTNGRTLFYGIGGRAYGVERYLPGRRVIWSFLDGDCRDGIWSEDAGQICFLYEDRVDPQCWTFAETANGLTARFEADTDVIELYEAEDIGEEMLCYGPDVGV